MSDHFNKFLEWTTKPLTPFHAKKCFECSACNYELDKYHPVFLTSEILDDYKIDFWACMLDTRLRTIFAKFSETESFYLHDSNNFTGLYDPQGRNLGLETRKAIFLRLRQLLAERYSNYV